jgi:hypothetical protein
MTEPQICPSTTGKTRNAQIIGFIGADGVVANIPTPIPLTEEMRDSIGPQPERIFRLAGPCIQSKCANWENQACALIDRMRQQVERLQLATEPAGKLPRCAIRSRRSRRTFAGATTCSRHAACTARSSAAS